MAQTKQDEQHPAVSFFRQLYAHTKGGSVELRAIANDKLSPPRRVFTRSPPEIAAFAEKYGGKDSKYGCYFGICKRDIEGDGSKKSIKRVPALWVDLDTVKNGWDTDEVLKRIHAIDGVLRPTACVRSGGGLHLYWLLDHDPKLDMSVIEAANTTLRNVFAGDAVQNVDRIFRLPGTWNTKRRPAKRVEVAWCYDFDRVNFHKLYEAALNAKFWIDDTGNWKTAVGVRRKLTTAAVTVSDPMDTFAGLYGEGSRNMSKNLDDMWQNRVRYGAPRGSIGIHEAALRHTAIAYIANKDMTEHSIVEIVVKNIQRVKDQWAPEEEWDMDRERIIVRDMWRTWQPKWKAYVAAAKREKKANGGTSRVRQPNRCVQGKAAGGKLRSA